MLQLDFKYIESVRIYILINRQSILGDFLVKILNLETKSPTKIETSGKKNFDFFFFK